MSSAYEYKHLPLLTDITFQLCSIFLTYRVALVGWTIFRTSSQLSYPDFLTSLICASRFVPFPWNRVPEKEKVCFLWRDMTWLLFRCRIKGYNKIFKALFVLQVGKVLFSSPPYRKILTFLAYLFSLFTLRFYSINSY